MNWFERYGIPGLYFSAYVFLCVFYSHFPIEEKDSNISNILTVLAGLSLPAGYLISIFSQLLYYKLFLWLHVHRYAMDKNKSEEILEVEMVKISRLNLHADKVDKCRWASEWLSKRVDVIAINNSIIIATILGFGLSLKLHPFLYHSVALPEWRIIRIISLIIIGILSWNTCLLSKQVKIVTKALYKNKDDLEKNK